MLLVIVILPMRTVYISTNIITFAYIVIVNNNNYKLALHELGIKTAWSKNGKTKQLFGYNYITLNYLHTIRNDVSKIIAIDDHYTLTEFLFKNYILRSKILSGICPYKHNRTYGVVLNLLMDKTNSIIVRDRLMQILYIAEQLIGIINIAIDNPDN